MAIKKIAIIGGGISGLSLLHFLNKKYGGSVSITLYERNASAGGNVRTSAEDDFVFETGPNGFLTNQPDTSELIADIGLNNDVFIAKKAERFLQLNKKLYPLPTDLFSFLSSSLFSARDKFLLLRGIFKKDVSPDQSVYNYAAARFGKYTAERIVDPFVSGVFAGDVHRLHMYSAFGKMLAPKKNNGKAILCSFRFGMGQLTGRLIEQYASQIKASSLINSLDEIEADRIICTAPAYAVAGLFARTNPSLTKALESIHYAPVAVVGLGFDAFAFKSLPKGFGYLVPSDQHKEVLGVLIESNVFEKRAPKERIMVRVMMGGRHHPNIANEDVRILKERAEAEINEIYGLKKHSIKHWVKVWPKAIPQYELEYPACLKAIEQELTKIPRLTLAGNYLGGVAVNDCIYNAKCIANKLTI